MGSQIFWRAWLTTWWRVGYERMREANMTGYYVLRGGKRMWSVP